MASGPVSSVQSLSSLTLCNPMDWTCQASLSITNSSGLLKLMSIESVMPSKHLIFYCPLLLLPLVFPSIRVFSNESVLLWFHQFMANRWRSSGNSDRLYFLGLLNLCDGDCSHEIKRHLLLGRKTITKLESTLESRDIIFPTKARIVKAMFSSSHGLM